MKKIIVVSSGSASTVPLILELQRLFPECEIEVVTAAQDRNRGASRVS